MASVLIVDDQPLIHVGLQQVLRQEYRGLVFGRAKSSGEAAVRLSSQAWDLVILGVAVPATTASAFSRRSSGFTPPRACSY